MTNRTNVRARRAASTGLCALGLLFAPAARAEPATPATPATPDAPPSLAPAERDVRAETPILANTYQAAGVSARTLGAQTYGLGMGASGGVGFAGARKGVVGGGFTIWGSPLERLTLIGDGARDVTGNFAPSAAVVVRLFGRADDGLSLGLLGKFKIEGFGVGPNDEIESEIEGGVLLSYARYAWHLDANAITGFGTGDDGEIDAEARLRLGRDVGPFRLGIDEQARYRVSGATSLVGGRSGDFQGGAQAMLAGGHFFGALTAGPTTTNVYSGIGWSGVVTIGGSSL